MSDAFEQLAELGRRFAGVDIQFRRTQPGWLAPWRVRLLASKNEREDYRIERVGDTFEEAARLVIDRAAAITRGEP